MIQRSRRQRASERSESETFSLHLQLARRSAWHRRLIRASLGCLLASIVTVALRWPVGQQIAALALGFGAGLLIPVRGHLEAALARIREQAGLSYETALEQGDAADPYGLNRAVRLRAQLGTRDVKGASHPAWWLPALAAAIALLVLPLAAAPRAGSRPFVPEQAAPADTARPPEPVPDDAQPVPEPPEQAPDRALADPGDSATSGASEQDVSGAAADGLTEQEALAQYLQELRDRPAAATEPEGGDASDARGAQGTNPPQAEQRPRDTPREGEQGDARNGEPVGETTGGEPQDQQAGEPGQQGEPGASDEAQGAEPSGPEGDEGEGAQADAGADTQAEAGAGEPGGTEPGVQPDEGGLQQSAAGNQAGPGTSPGSPVTAPASQPEFLGGVLQEGPETAGGAIRLPGSSDVQLPPGTTISSYQNAAEQALSEGDVPLEYQEIIRRYFR